MGVDIFHVKQANREMRYGYYNYKGERKGDFSGKEIKRLAKAGIITPETIIETPEGDKYKAVGIEGVEFGNEHTEDEQDSSISLPENWKVTLISSPPGMPKWTQWLEEIEERKKHPEHFCDYITATIAMVQVVFVVLFIESLAVTSLGLLMCSMVVIGSLTGILPWGLLALGIVQLPLIFLLRSLAITFLKYIRSAFCHQFVIEQFLEKHVEHIQKHTETLKYRNNVETVGH